MCFIYFFQDPAVLGSTPAWSPPTMMTSPAAKRGIPRATTGGCRHTMPAPACTRPIWTWPPCVRTGASFSESCNKFLFSFANHSYIFTISISQPNIKFELTWYNKQIVLTNTELQSLWWHSGANLTGSSMVVAIIDQISAQLADLMLILVGQLLLVPAAGTFLLQLTLFRVEK